jgi:hypothetical protein
MHSLGIRLLLTYHRTQVLLRRMVSRWEIGDLPCAALGAVMVFGMTMLVTVISGMSVGDTVLWSLGGLLITGSWLLHALRCISNEDLEQRILSIRGALAAAAAPRAREPTAAVAAPCAGADIKNPLEQATAALPPTGQMDASIPSAQPTQASTEGDSLAAFLNSFTGEQRLQISPRSRRERRPSALVGCFAFVLCVPIGVTVAVIISRALFPQANGAAPTGLAVFCCYMTYQGLLGMFGRN